MPDLSPQITLNSIICRMYHTTPPSTSKHSLFSPQAAAAADTINEDQAKALKQEISIGG